MYGHGCGDQTTDVGTSHFTRLICHLSSCLNCTTSGLPSLVKSAADRKPGLTWSSNSPRMLYEIPVCCTVNVTYMCIISWLVFGCIAGVTQPYHQSSGANAADRSTGPLTANDGTTRPSAASDGTTRPPAANNNAKRTTPSEVYNAGYVNNSFSAADINGITSDDTYPGQNVQPRYR